MKKRFAVSMLALASLALVACGGGESTDKPTEKPTEPVGTKDTIVIGSPTTNHAFVQKQVNDFLKAEGLDAKYEVKMYDLNETEVTNITDWSAPTAPDIYSFPSDVLGKLKGNGAVSVVPDAFVDEMKANFNETAVGAATIGQDVYGYPFSGDNGYFLYYNKDIVAESQTDTVDNIVAACAAQGTKFAYALDTDSTFFSIGTFMSFGSRYEVKLNKDGTFASASSTFADATGIKAAEGVYNLLHNENIITTHKGGRDVAPTKANKIGAIVEGSWKYDAYKKELGDKLGLCKLPTITVGEETKNLSSFLGYKIYGVNDKKSAENSERLIALHKVANFLASEKTQEARFDELTVIPTNKKVAASENVKSSDLAQALFAQSEFSVAQTITPNQIWTAAATAVDSLKTSDDFAAIMKTFDETIKASTGF